MAESSTETNMDRVMGCPNEVILAFAEIADLEARKDELVKRFHEGLPAKVSPVVGFGPGWRSDDHNMDPHTRWRQAMSSLEAEGRQIERLIPEALGPSALPIDRFVEVHPVPSYNGAGNTSSQSQSLEFSGIDLNLFGGNPPDAFSWINVSNHMQTDSSANSANPVPEPELGGYVDPDEDKRGKIAEVFRNAARVYLHSVISGCDPLVPATRRAVQATIRALQVCYSPLSSLFLFFQIGFLWPSSRELWTMGQLLTPSAIDCPLRILSCLMGAGQLCLLAQDALPDALTRRVPISCHKYFRVNFGINPSHLLPINPAIWYT